MEKQRVTVWSNGKVTTVQYGEINSVLVLEDMGEERYTHSRLPSTLSIEEIGNTLVVTKETGTVHVYTYA